MMPIHGDIFRILNRPHFPLSDFLFFAFNTLSQAHLRTLHRSLLPSTANLRFFLYFRASSIMSMPPCINFPAFRDPIAHFLPRGTYPPPEFPGQRYLKIFHMEVWERANTPAGYRYHSWIYRCAHYVLDGRRGLRLSGYWDCCFCMTCKFQPSRNQLRFLLTFAARRL